MKPGNWPKVEELYHAALAKDAAEREAERLMERPAASAATQKLAVVPGTRLGPYEVIEPVEAGQGGHLWITSDRRQLLHCHHDLSVWSRGVAYEVMGLAT